MKVIVKNFALLAVLAIVFSSLSGCGSGTSGSAVGNQAGTTGNAANNAADDGSAYPQLASKVADFEFTTLDGTTTKISDRKGKVLLLNLWGVWCMPCREEMPHLIEMQNKHRDAGFQVLGLNVGDDWGEPEDPEKMKKFVAEMNLNYEIAAIPEELTNEIFRISQGQAVPTSLLVDREGRLRGVFVGGSSRVVKKMKETVDLVVAGKATGNVAKEGGPAASNSAEGEKLEMIEIDPTTGGPKKQPEASNKQ
jgi:thiol-disulfide isomerase/thioredoxin